MTFQIYFWKIWKNKGVLYIKNKLNVNFTKGHVVSNPQKLQTPTYFFGICFTKVFCKGSISFKFVLEKLSRSIKVCSLYFIFVTI